MYAKERPAPPKYDFPYQKQRQDSGSVVNGQSKSPSSLSDEEIEAIEAAAKKLMGGQAHGQ